MADTEIAAAAAATSPAEVTQTESTDVKPGHVTNGDSKADAGEEKWALNGKSDAREERCNDGNDRRGGGRGRGRGQGRGRGGFHNNRKRNEEFDNLPESDDPVEIRNQVEFYFSTHNLVTDEHLFSELGGPLNRPVSIKHIADFKRMRRFRPYSAIVSALRESKDLVVVDDGEYNGTGKEAVKRKEPITVPTEEGDEERKPSTLDLFYRLKKASSNKLETSVYAKNFGNPDEAGQIALEQFFRPYGAVMVRKRRDHDDGAWKGSVFVEFDSEDSQKQFLALDPKPKFNGNELCIMGKKEYIIMKCEQKGIEPDFGNKTWEANGNRSRGNDRGGRGRGRGGRGDRRGRGSRGGYDGRDRSPRRRRDRSNSAGSVESRDWNNRRDRFQKGKDDRSSRKEENRKEVERDGHGVPIVKDTRADADADAGKDSASNKRKADDGDRADSPKKGKLEIKQDE
ncbi:hypothetical protein ACEQ8H_005931 [Pleosporales sp. CAS-2024a]